MFGGRRSFLFDDGMPDRSTMAPASKAALRREETAREAFKKARIEMEQRRDVNPGEKVVIELLQPGCHLTSHCWRQFSRHVRTHPNWNPKRREASPEEKRASKETRKGKVYFISVVYTVPKTSTNKVGDSDIAATASSVGNKRTTNDFIQGASIPIPNGATDLTITQSSEVELKKSKPDPSKEGKIRKNSPVTHHYKFVEKHAPPRKLSLAEQQLNFKI